MKEEEVPRKYLNNDDAQLFTQQHWVQTRPVKVRHFSEMSNYSFR